MMKTFEEWIKLKECGVTAPFVFAGQKLKKSPDFQYEGDPASQARLMRSHNKSK